ncbi:MAG TPA: SUMF1/EgtB/PvdO family nonheme iron enzyme [Lacipirellulaceae bacterium]|nr:SUMF1/EgtB/PvdO family nonheme iron enzyme [Lacipirellulaceae bacterium]
MSWSYTNLVFSLLLISFNAVQAEETSLRLVGEIINGPKGPAGRPTWIEEMSTWREAAHKRIKYDDAQYRRPELLWAQRAFIQPQAMVEDRYFYDPVAGKYTVDRYLDDVTKRYGGIDAVLLWPVYPNIGIDDRNQHDLHRDLPGGVPGVRQMVDDFHHRGVRVLFPAMPWDTGTRDEGKPLAQSAVELVKQFGADGINGDTMPGIPRDFFEASTQLDYPVGLQPEGAFHDQEMLAWNTMSWGYWKYEQVPVVSQYKWLEPRHMVNVCERWARDRTNGLQSAYFNGVGYESWENVWGIWNQFTPRDAEALRRIATIERGVADLLVSAQWEPHVETLQSGVYASRFPGKDRTLWLLVNRTDKTLSGAQMEVPAPGNCFDLWHGVNFPKASGDSKKQRLSFDVEAHGYGAILSMNGAEPDKQLTNLMATMAALSKQRLSDFSSDWKPLPQKIVEITKTQPAAAAPDGMVLIPEAKKYQFKVSGIEIEGKDEPGVDVQYPWEEIPRRHHENQMPVNAFYIDKHPVTNQEFKRFLEATNYHPKDDHNFLRDWKNGSFPAGWEKKPVTWVSLEDARAYASWAGKRLPHEWEWQYAAQGLDERAYPWGNGPKPNAVPAYIEKSRVMPPPDNVDAHPAGASPFDVMDMVGNIWQWTDEFQDEHTRAAIVRGGGHYRPIASKWYFPNTTSLNQHGKYLLMAPSKDRSGAIGFRCVVDR